MKRGDKTLSLWRTLLAVVALLVLGTGGTYAARQHEAAQSATSTKPWFAAYVDVTATPTYAFDQLGSTTHRDVMLSFIVAAAKDDCTPSWGSAYTLDQAGDSLDLDRRIAHLQQQGGHVAVSFGGQRNHEMSINCTDPAKLYTAYSAVLDRYKISTIDLDIEGPDLSNKEAGVRRATVLAKLQADRRQHGKKLAIWLTLPVTPQGLSEDGTTMVTQLLDRKVDLAGVNAMTMDYGQSKSADQSMQAASESALTRTAYQLGILYQKAGINLNAATIWSKIGATPMVGQNDEAKEVFTVKDATGFNLFARKHGVGRMSMWSANRDRACGSNYVDLKTVSDSCSGVIQAPQGFATLLSDNFKGNVDSSAGVVTTSNKTKTVQKADDPNTSPYQIWSMSGTYLQGTKIVWHHNVYQAKYYTQGDTPDNPVLQSYQTPWELVGPVLPGEKPIPQATLPEGTFPEWDGKTVYDSNNQVLFKGVPYQAKWYNVGQSPAAASANPNDSPWKPLTQEQINNLTKS